MVGVFIVRPGGGLCAPFFRLCHPMPFRNDCDVAISLVPIVHGLFYFSTERLVRPTRRHVTAKH